MVAHTGYEKRTKYGRLRFWREAEICTTTAFVTSTSVLEPQLSVYNYPVHGNFKSRTWRMLHFFSQMSSFALVIWQPLRFHTNSRKQNVKLSRFKHSSIKPKQFAHWVLFWPTLNGQLSTWVNRYTDSHWHLRVDFLLRFSLDLTTIVSSHLFRKMPMTIPHH